MADSDITVDGLTATGGPQQVALTWNTPIDTHTPGGLPSLQKEVIEIWASSTNSRSAASKIGEEPGSNTFLHTNLTRAQTFYYWIRARQRGRASDGSSVYGEWHPVSSTAGVVGMESNNDLVIQSNNGYWKIPPSGGLIFQYGTATVGGTLDAVSISFRTTFPNRCLSLVISPAMVFTAGGTAIMPVAWSSNIVTSGFQCKGYALAERATGELEIFLITFPINYQAWGY